MITIIVFGMPELPQDDFESLIENLQRSIANDLSINPSEVAVFFPNDRCARGLGSELISLITGARKGSGIERIVSSVLLGFAQDKFPELIKRVEVHHLN